MFKNSETKIYPDKDSIKMFVGQLPENIELIELKQLFEKFGKVYEIKMIKNLKTGESKNCCFVKYYTRESALNAQTNLNNKCVENSDKPIQMKPADFNLKNRKIFVGMISHKLEEDSLCKLFLKFGPIDDCKILRDLNGRSKCCAFITFKTKQSAANAIKFMHHNLIMENCHYPLNVKYADQFPIKLDQDQDSLILADSDDQNDSALLSFQKLIQNINNFKPKRYKYDENEFKSELNDSNNCKYLFALNYDTLSDYITNKFY